MDHFLNLARIRLFLRNHFEHGRSPERSRLNLWPLVLVHSQFLDDYSRDRFKAVHWNYLLALDFYRKWPPFNLPVLLYRSFRKLVSNRKSFPAWVKWSNFLNSFKWKILFADTDTSRSCLAARRNVHTDQTRVLPDSDWFGSHETDSQPCVYI